MKDFSALWNSGALDLFIRASFTQSNKFSQNSLLPILPVDEFSGLIDSRVGFCVNNELLLLLSIPANAANAPLLYGGGTSRR